MPKREWNRTKLRRRFLLAATFIIMGVLFIYVQNNWIDLQEAPVSLAELPRSFDGFRIAQISDLHGKEFGSGNKTLLEKLRTAKPDLIVITGDLVDDPAQFVPAGVLAAKLCEIAPTYYVTGNHEWATRAAPELIRILKKQGVEVLQNEYRVLRRDGESLVIAGIDDPNGPKDQKTLEDLTAEIRTLESNPFILLLAHRNDGIKNYAACGIPLTLSGHGHGGLIRLPFTDGLISTDRTFFPAYTNGLYFQGESAMFVSRGLGNVGRTLRLFNRPHLPVLILKYAG